MGDEIMKHLFKNRKPALPYRKPGVELQFYTENETEHIKKTITLEDGSTEDVIVKYSYDRYDLPWREEFGQGAEYNENGENLQKDYVTENYEFLLAEAKQI